MPNRDRSTPRVSVVIPCYNGRQYLDECLRSIAAVDDGSYEAVVVDDGSKEEIRDVVERWAPLARYVRQTNQGPGAARNTGLRETTGEYVRFLDCDDVLLPGAVADQMALLDGHPEVGFVHGQAMKIEPDGRPFEVRRPGFARGTMIRSGEDELGDLLLGNYVTTSTTLVRRQVLERAGPFRTDIIGPEDWDCWLRIAQVTSFGYVDRPVVGYRVHATSITALYTPTRWLEMHHDILDRRFGDPAFPRRLLDRQRAARARLNATAAVLAYWHGRMGLARGYAFDGLLSALPNRRWRQGVDCAWLIAKSFVPTGLHRRLRRMARRYRADRVAVGWAGV